MKEMNYNKDINKNKKINPYYSQYKKYDNYMDDLYAQTDRLIDSAQLNARYYFVVGHTVNGGRFYSETFIDFLKAIKTYHRYCDTVRYFGGGTVELLCITDDDFDIVSISRV